MPSADREHRSTRRRRSLVALVLLGAPVLLTAARCLAEEGLEVTGAPGVSDEALQRARYTVGQMLSEAPQVLRRMLAEGFKIVVVRRDQVLSDLPDYASLKGQKTRDGRSFDTGTRGLGGPRECSVGEENLLCLPRQKYPQEDVLVHEFSHSVMANLGPEVVAEIRSAYREAMNEGLYPATAYMARDAREYWAEGAQAWFGVTVRSDVNGGVNTREKLKAHDPRLAALLERVYGTVELARAPGCRY